MNETNMTAGSGKKPTTSPTKVATMLLIFWAGARLTRFDAERHHDHCLHSTVSTLEGLGVEFERHWERVPCLGGTRETRCKRYWMKDANENRARAHALLKTWGLA